MRLLPARVDAELVPLPEEGDARLSGDPEIDREVQVLIGLRLSFAFRRREDGDWELLGAWTAARGFPLDEAWVAAARELACRAFRQAIGDGADTARCPECGKVLCSPLLAPQDGAWKKVQVRCSVDRHDAYLLDLGDGFGGALGRHRAVRFDATGRAEVLPGRWELPGIPRPAAEEPPVR